MSGRGKVTLVGAGPGSPDLLTLRAARALAEADLVLFDALVEKDVLDLAPRAAKLSVGKRAGVPSISQDQIHARMIRAARQGRRVVRLKAGDPFVFGRGSEEAIALGEAGVAVEVVPGLSSALSGPLAFGIPVTHRGVASAFVVATAVPEAPFAALATTLPTTGVTVVVLMALKSRAFVRDALLARGFAPETPAAIVVGAHHPGAWSWSGTLTELADVELPPGELPGLVVIGDVVSVGAAVERALHPAPESGTALVATSNTAYLEERLGT